MPYTRRLFREYFSPDATQLYSPPSLCTRIQIFPASQGTKMKIDEFETVKAQYDLPHHW